MVKVLIRRLQILAFLIFGLFQERAIAQVCENLFLVIPKYSLVTAIYNPPYWNALRPSEPTHTARVGGVFYGHSNEVATDGKLIDYTTIGHQNIKSHVLSNLRIITPGEMIIFSVYDKTKQIEHTRIGEFEGQSEDGLVTTVSGSRFITKDITSISTEGLQPNQLIQYQILNNRGIPGEIFFGVIENIATRTQTVRIRERDINVPKLQILRAFDMNDILEFKFMIPTGDGEAIHTYQGGPYLLHRDPRARRAGDNKIIGIKVGFGPHEANDFVDIQDVHRIQSGKFVLATYFKISANSGLEPVMSHGLIELLPNRRVQIGDKEVPYARLMNVYELKIFDRIEIKLKRAVEGLNLNSPVTYQGQDPYTKEFIVQQGGQHFRLQLENLESVELTE